MTFANAICTCLRKYVTFSGRASRPEYWKFVLAVFLVSLLAGALDAIIFGTRVVQTAPGEVAVQSDGPIASLFSLAVFLPLLSAGGRRMHDTGRSGFYLLYPLIVIVGIASAISFLGGMSLLDSGFAGGAFLLLIIPAMIVLLISPLLVLWWLTRPTQPVPNDYGPVPSEVAR